MPGTIAVVGLGGMGSGAARRLLDEGHRLVVWNRTPGKAAPLIERGADVAGTPGEAAAAAGIVITFVADDAALEEVTLGADGIAQRLRPGGIHLSMSTIAPTTAQRLVEAHRAQGCAYVAAPVFGRPDAAAAGQLWIVTSGPAAAKAKIRKMAEAWTLGEKCGLDRGQLAEFFAASLFPSRIYQHYGKLIAEHRYEPPGFKLRLGLKDLRLVLGTADAHQMPMPLASLLHDRLLALAAQGHGEIDWTGIGLGVARDAGTTRP